jgi:hypothetical protein
MGYTPNKNDFGVYKQLAQLQPAAKNTAESLYSPSSDEEVHIKNITVVNLNNKDVNFVIYVDDDGTTFNDTTTTCATKLKKDSYEEILSGSEIFMNNSSGALGFEASNTDFTITVWGVVYDIS